MRYFLLAVLLVTGCTQDKPKTQTESQPKYAVIADDYLGVVLKHMFLYVLDDLNGDKKDEAAMVEEGEDKVYRLNLYLLNEDKWILTNRITIETIGDNHPVGFPSYPVTNLILPVSIPDDNLLVALNVDGIPGKEVLVAYNGTTRNAILVYKVTNNTLLKIAEFKENIAELSGGK
ncbi:MAG: hypothetical protein HPY53_03705 [Brevinematales bacterium]|nr:hypothetical protein [Brevinematales bacterium]